MRKVSQLIKESAEERGMRGPGPNGDYSICCPLCWMHGYEEDTKFKMSINPSVEHQLTGDVASFYHCFKCDSAGRFNAQWMGDYEGEAQPVGPVDLGPPEKFAPLSLANPKHAPYLKYLAERKVLHAARDMGVGACIGGKYWGRAILPAKSRGEWVGWVGRSVHPGRDPAYLNCPGMDRKSYLWGMDEAMERTEGELWFVEGPFDALRLYPRAVCSLGKGVSPEQMDQLLSLGRPIVVCLDGDAWTEAQVLATKLRFRGGNAKWCRLPPKTDPGQLGWHVQKYVQQR